MIRESKFICEISTYDELWHVFLKPRPSMEDASGGNYDGLTVNTTHEIHIANDLDVYREREVVYHEVAHAFNNSLYGRKETFTHEEMCDFIGRYGRNIHEQAEKILQHIERAK